LTNEEHMEGTDASWKEATRYVENIDRWNATREKGKCQMHLHLRVWTYSILLLFLFVLHSFFCICIFVHLWFPFFIAFSFRSCFLSAFLRSICLLHFFKIPIF
jgi:hypothetical protein